MKISACLLATTLLLMPPSAHAAWFTDNTAAPAPVCIGSTQISATFSPAESATATIVQEIGLAQHSIRLAGQHFNSKSVAIALLQASRSGKDIKIVLDHGELTTGYSGAGFFTSMTLPVRFSPPDSPQLSNYILIDDSDLIIGTLAGVEDETAEKHVTSSVLVLHHSPEIVARYAQDFQSLWSGASPPPPVTHAQPQH